MSRNIHGTVYLWACSFLKHVPFAKFYFVAAMECNKMPPDKGVKIWIGIGSDKGASPINLCYYDQSIYVIMTTSRHSVL